MDGGDTDLLALGGNGLRSQHGGVGLDIVKGKHKSHSHILKDLMILTDDSSRSALTCIPPVTREMVSFPERSVTWTKVSLNLCSTSAIRQLCLLALLDRELDLRGEDVSNPEHQSVVGLGAEVGDGVLLGGSDFGGLQNTS